MNQGYLYSGGSFTNIAVPGAIDSYAFGINNAGQIVREYQVDTNYIPQGFLYSGGVYTHIAVPGSINTVATGINNDGQIAGWYTIITGMVGQSIETARYGFIYEISSGTYTTLSDPLTQPSWGTNPFGINDAGRSSGLISTEPTSPSSIATASTRPFLHPVARILALRMASTTQARSLGITTTVVASTVSLLGRVDGFS